MLKACQSETFGMITSHVLFLSITKDILPIKTDKSNPSPSYSKNLNPTIVVLPQFQTFNWMFNLILNWLFTLIFRPNCDPNLEPDLWLFYLKFTCDPCDLLGKSSL